MREQVPADWAGFFAAVTRSGSAKFLLPLALMAVLALLLAKRLFEALLMGVSMATATLFVYGLKALVGRARPELWETQAYWGSSFPSGHALSSAAFGTTAALCLGAFVALLFSVLFDRQSITANER